MINIGLKIIAVELVSSTLVPPENLAVLTNTFKFKLSVEFIPNIEKQIIITTTHIDVVDNDDKIILGSISVNCIFSFENLEEVINIKPDGEATINIAIREKLIDYSTSTTRGVMFSTFKGTFLHNAILPLL